jgi:hypothetical protein
VELLNPLIVRVCAALPTWMCCGEPFASVVA